MLTMNLKRLKRIEYRESLLKQLLGINVINIDFREERSCHNRLLFLDICNVILKHFSRKFFRDHFFQHYLSMFRDPVANIRLRFVSMLPLVRRTLRSPLDAIYIQKLLDIIEPLMTRDLAPDVMVSMNHITAKFGPFDNRYIPHTETDFDPGDVDFGMIPRKSFIKRSKSEGSITDLYLFEAAQEIIEPLSEKDDREREEEEMKLLFEIPAADWNSKRQPYDAHRLRKYNSSKKANDIPKNTSKVNVISKKVVIAPSLANPSASTTSAKSLPSSAASSPISGQYASSTRPRRLTSSGSGEQSPFATSLLTSDVKQMESDLARASTGMTKILPKPNTLLTKSFPKVDSSKG